MGDQPQTTEPMFWLWRDHDAPTGFWIYPTRTPKDEHGDPKVIGEPEAGPLSLNDAQRYVEQHDNG